MKHASRNRPAGRRLVCNFLLLVAACSWNDRATAPRPPGPEFAISDAVHEGGTPGFYFLPPMVGQPTFNGTFDADIATLNPAIAICDVTNDVNCGGSSATLIVYTPTSTPAITLDPTTPQYQVNWNTQAAGFVAGHTYRVHVTVEAGGARRELGFADVLLTTTPGQAKRVETGDIIVLQDGRTLPIHVRIETGIACDCWVTKTPMPTARSFLGVGVVDGMLYAVGGVLSNTGFLGTVEAYDPTTNSWTTKTPMPTPRHRFAVGVINGVLYAVGGVSTGSPFGTLEAYDPTTDAWTTKAPMPTPRYDLAVAVVNGKLYAVGGTLFNLQVVGTVEVYDPTTDSWTTRASLPAPRSRLGIGVLNGVLYTMGGEGSADGPAIGTVEAYDPATDAWTARASMLTPRKSFGVGVVNGVLHAVGGSSNAGVLGTHEVYDPLTDTWTTHEAMPTPRSELGAGVVNGVLYAVGGDDHVVVLATNEALTGR